MTIMVDFEIRAAIKSGQLIVEPFDEQLIQPNSIDVRLGREFAWTLPNHDDPAIDPYDQSTLFTSGSHTVISSSFLIEPGQFVLGCTLEKISLPKNIVGQLTGKSSLARLGIMVHVTAGFIDAGFSHPPATITLEIVNVGNRPVKLHAYMPIGQLIFTRTLMCETAYHEKPGAKYNNQGPAQSSKYYLNNLKY